jgi:hypothetical protein
MRHAHAPIIAVEHVVHIEKKGRDHKIGARGFRAKRGAPGRCGTTLKVVLDILSCFLQKKLHRSGPEPRVETFIYGKWTAEFP